MKNLFSTMILVVCMIIFVGCEEGSTATTEPVRFEYQGVEYVELQNRDLIECKTYLDMETGIMFMETPNGGWVELK